MNIAWLILALHTVAASASVTHALLYKKDPRSALGWIAASIAYPIIGPVLYFFFGINRVKTRALRLQGKPSPGWFNYERSDLRAGLNDPATPLPPPVNLQNSTMNRLAQSSAAVTLRPLTVGNDVSPLFSGDAAYQAMLSAIAQARESVCLSSYIFDTKNTGGAFIDALAQAKQRGVDVRVLLDGVGEFYSFPKAGSRLKKAGINVARFAPPRLIPPFLHINLRNHRKLLIIDHRLGFTGGMNIGDHHLSVLPNGKPGIQDVHFRLEGEIVAQLQQAFEEDWAFVTGNPIREIPPAPAPRCGDAACRVVTDGPNEDFEKLITIITGACALAQRRIAIITPYFLPPTILINALNTAALRGVDVRVILPARSNQPLVDWATRNMLWELLQHGVQVFLQPPPFNHSKLLLIDEHYAHIGSANLDPRSLRLNFELTVEVFDEGFVASLAAHFSRLLAGSTAITLAEVDSRSFPVRIRDALAWLFSPYL